MEPIAIHNDRVAFDDGALYVIYYRENLAQGKWKNKLVLRHAFSMDSAERNFKEECEETGTDYVLYRIMQACEMRRYIYE